MPHHIDTIQTVLGALMLLCGAGSWFATLRQKWKASNALYSAFYTVWGVSILLGGLNLGPVPTAVSFILQILALCLGVVGAALRVKEVKVARQASDDSEAMPNPNGPQFQGYRTTPRI